MVALKRPASCDKDQSHKLRLEIWSASNDALSSMKSNRLRRSSRGLKCKQALNPKAPDATVCAMKTTKKVSEDSVATPILQDVIERHKSNSKLQNPTLSETASGPADLYQDAGGRYSTNFTFPQE